LGTNPRAVWRSKIFDVIGGLRNDLSDNVNRAAEDYIAEVQLKLAGGYKTGKFVTGATALSARVREFATPESLTAVVGSSSIVAVSWEFGHVNLFTRQFERNEIWRETLVDFFANFQFDFSK